MGRRERQRGKRGEREAAKALEDCLGVRARRGVQYAGGPESPDVQIDVEGIHCEVKYCEREQVRKWMAQTITDAGTKVPFLLHRKARADWLCTVPLDRLHDLVLRLAESVVAQVPEVGAAEVSSAVPPAVLRPAAEDDGRVLRIILPE